MGSMGLCPSKRRSKITAIGNCLAGEGIMFGGVPKRYDMRAKE